MAPLDRHSITTRVLVLQGAGWVTLLLLVGVTAWTGATDIHAVSQARRQQLTAVLREQIDQLIADDLAKVQALSASPTLNLDDQDLTPERLLLADIVNRADHIERISLAGPTGAVLLQEPATANAGPVDPTAVAQAFTTGQLVARPHATTGLDVDVLVPLRHRSGRVEAVAVVAVTPRSHAITSLLETGGATIIRSDAAREATRAPLTSMPWAVALGDDTSAGTSSNLATALWWGLPVSLLLGIAFAWGTANSLRRPLMALTQAAERMTAGDLETPLPNGNTDEIGRLRNVLETLRRELQRSLETISQHADELETRVRDRTRDLDEMCHRLNERDQWRRHLLRKVISAQEDERGRVARELHDDICQALVALAVSVDVAIEHMRGGAERDRLELVKGAVRASLADLHRIIHDLRPAVLDDLGLFPALRWLADEMERRTGVRAKYEFGVAEIERLPTEFETALFRVVQEALTNVERHASADNVLLQVWRERDLLMIEIEDDGAGFETASANTASTDGRGLGLRGMRERVELLGGSLLLSSSPGNGTRLLITIPVTSSPAMVQQ